MSTCNRLDLQTLRSQPVILKISPITGSYELVVVKVAILLSFISKLRHDNYLYGIDLKTITYVLPLVLIVDHRMRCICCE